MSDYQNIEVTCVCGVVFDWTPGEQTFLNDLVSAGKIQSVQQPKRCVDCRRKRKEERNDSD